MRKLAAKHRLTYTLCRPQWACAFPSLGPPDYTGGRVANVHFNLTYISAEFARGSVGLEDVTIAGLTVRNQQMSLSDEVYTVTANNFTTGVIGEFYLQIFCDVSNNLAARRTCF